MNGLNSLSVIFFGRLYWCNFNFGLVIIIEWFEKLMCLFKRFWWKWFCLFFSMFDSDFSGCLLVLVIMWLWWLLLNRVLIDFCSICFLLWMMMFGVCSLIRCFRWLFWLIMWWYRLFRFEVVKWLLFNGISGCSLGGMIGIMVRIIYFGWLFDFKKFLMIFRCLMIFLGFSLFVVFFNFLCSCLVVVLRLIIDSILWIVLVLMLVWNVFML